MKMLLITWLMAKRMQSCPRVGWTRGSGRVGSGRVGSGHDFVGFLRVWSGRVSTFDFLVFSDYFSVPESIGIFKYYIRID